MGVIINRCAKCGHEWAQAGKMPPRRCPAAECRTVKWARVDTGFYEQVLDPAAATSKRDALAAAKRMLNRYGK